MTRVATPGLVLDIQALQSATSRDRGIARYVAGHATALAARERLVRGLHLNPALPEPGTALPDALRDDPRLRWGSARAIREAQAAGPIAYCVMSPFELVAPAPLVLPDHALRGDIPLVVTLYDLIPMLRSATYLDRDPALARRYRQRLELVRQADLVLAISEQTRRDGIEHLGLDPDRVSAIGTGVDPFFFPTGTPPTQRVPGLQPRFVLTVSGADERKNTPRLIAAWGRLPADLRRDRQLVVVCHLVAGLAEIWRDAARAAGLRDGELLLTGQVGDSVLRDLYRTCEVFVFPSLYEGFGLPLAEAMACGAPVITSRASSLPEVLDLDEASFDPQDVDDIARVLERALTDAAFRDRLRNAGRERTGLHRWEAVAERTAAAVERVLGETPAAAPRPATPRVALVGPLPPTPSGIANHDARLVPELERRSRLELFTASPRDGVVCDSARFLTSALGRWRHPASFDAVVYAVGNNEDHVDTWEAMQSVPGVVWFHDVRLDKLHAALAHAYGRGRPREWAASRLTAMYPDRSQPADPLDGDALAAAGMLLTRDWVAQARAVIVNNPVAERILVADQPAGFTMPPLTRMPGHLIPAIGGPEASKPDEPLVVSMGIVDPVKAPDVAIEALALVRRQRPARLALVGLVAPEHRAELLALAAELGLAEAVELTGHVDDGAYIGWLRRATCAVQLRRRSNGESSGAVADCIGAGLPVVTDIEGAAGEGLGDAAIVLEPSASAEAVASALLGILGDPAELARRRAATLEATLRRSPGVIADLLLAAVDRAGELRPIGPMPALSEQDGIDAVLGPPPWRA